MQTQLKKRNISQGAETSRQPGFSLSALQTIPSYKYTENKIFIEIVRAMIMISVLKYLVFPLCIFYLIWGNLDELISILLCS